MSASDDVSALRAEIETLRLRLEQGDVRTFEFVARLAHELRAPLGALLMWSHVLRMGREADRDAALDAIDASARAQSKMIGNLLDVSRALAGQLRIEKVPVDLQEPLRLAVEAVTPAAQARSVVLNVAVDGGEFPVAGDAARLREVIAHVLDNAVKFTPEGGAADVSLARSGNSARIVVRDSGRGIARAELASIFIPFRPAGETTVRSAGGLGLSLAFARLVTDLHGGTITADSAGAGRGATFTLEIPLRG